MAKKLDLDINTDSFLESIRPEMPPSSAQKKAEEFHITQGHHYVR